MFILCWKKGKNDISVFAYYQFLKTRPVGKTAEYAKRKFVALKPNTKAVYFEPTAELTRKSTEYNDFF